MFDAQSTTKGHIRVKQSVFPSQVNILKFSEKEEQAGKAETVALQAGTACKAIFRPTTGVKRGPLIALAWVAQDRYWVKVAPIGYELAPKTRASQWTICTTLSCYPKVITHWGIPGSTPSRLGIIPRNDSNNKSSRLRPRSLHWQFLETVRTRWKCTPMSKCFTLSASGAIYCA